jgi:hypothetical protein
MKRSSNYRIIFFSVFIFLIIPTSLLAEKMTDNWRLTGYTKYRDAIFADISRLSSPAPDTTGIWIKIAPSPKSKYLQFINEYLEIVRKRDKGFKSIEILCEINCTNHLIRFTRLVYMDHAGNIIHEANETNPRWLLIIQGSNWYPVEKEACAARK